jgi:hypothetical protein
VSQWFHHIEWNYSLSVMKYFETSWRTDPVINLFILYDRGKKIFPATFKIFVTMNVFINICCFHVCSTQFSHQHPVYCTVCDSGTSCGYFKNSFQHKIYLCRQYRARECLPVLLQSSDMASPFPSGVLNKLLVTNSFIINAKNVRLIKNTRQTVFLNK